MSNETENVVVTPTVELVKVDLTIDESKILTGLAKSPFFSGISAYLNQIVLDGGISTKDANKIDDFILDWINDNPGENLPPPLQFLQVAIVPKLNKQFAEELGVIPKQQDVVTQSATSTVRLNQEEYQILEPLLDVENLPSYINKINELIEREVRRRVKIQMKEYQELKIRHNELISKMEGISKMFSPKT